ncbi:MAG: hypothetical protein RLZ81_119 [Pseudomonadota bacterium]
MRRSIRFILFLALLPGMGIWAQEVPPGADVAGLLTLARQNNPELAGMRHEAQAALERVAPAAALPDPRFSMELRDLTRFGEQSASLSPARVGSTRYALQQDLPWFGKRELRRDIAQLEADAATARAQGSWTELAARIKSVHVQRYFLERNAQLAQEVLDLVKRLEQVAQGRYSSALGPQQDVIRAQVEQSAMRSELVALEGEGHHLMARLNALLARPVSAPLSAPQQLRALPASSELDPLVLQERQRAINPALQAEQLRVQAAQKARELGLRNRYPDFTVGLAPIQYRNAIKEWELMVELTIPLQQSTRRAQERESEAMLSAAMARREALANLVQSELSENLAAIEVARRNEALVASSLLPQAELTLQSALAAYENGKVDFATLLDAQRQIRQAKQSRIKTQLEAHLRLIEVERLLGEDL